MDTLPEARAPLRGRGQASKNEALMLIQQSQGRARERSLKITTTG